MFVVCVCCVVMFVCCGLLLVCVVVFGCLAWLGLVGCYCVAFGVVFVLWHVVLMCWCVVV